jgi:hypothetical protein
MAAGAQPVQPVPPQAPAETTSLHPNAKVSAGLLAGAISVLLCAFLKMHWKAWTGDELSLTESGAITTILTFLIQYLIPERT